MRAEVALGLVLSMHYAADAEAQALGQRDSDYQWRLCPAGRSIPLRPEYTEPDTPRDYTEIRADATRIELKGLTQFSGNVEVIQGEKALRADMVTYDEGIGVFQAEGGAQIWEGATIWSGNRATYDLGSRVSVLDEGEYWILNGRGRGQARVMTNDRNTNLTELSEVDYTTCPRSEEAWRVSASTIRLDHESDRGAARNAILRVRNVPVFYFPYVSFPLSDKRKSGFLAPTIGSSNKSGFDLQLPFYWNIAPNQDMTVSPRVLTDRGALLGGEYRYKWPGFEGEIKAEYLPDDALKNGEDRSIIAFEHLHTMLNKRGRLWVVVENVSDDQYFEDFGRSIGSTSQRFLPRRADFRYRGRHYNMRALVQSYQTLENLRGPYQMLPRLELRAKSPYTPYGIIPRFDVQTTYFDRDDSVVGGRVDLRPTIEIPYIKPYLELRTKLALRHTEYFLDDPNRVFDDHESRTVPILNINSKLFFERDLNLFGTSHIQTFEPRAFYLLIPHVGQDDIPRFDTGLYDISFLNIFRTNRFTGRDRVGDANQMTLAATSRVLNAVSGRETLRLSLGQIFFFRDREVGLAPGQEEDESVSELIAESAANLGNGWSARGTLQWDPDARQTEKSAITLRYRPNLDTVVNLSYRLRRAAVSDIEQTDFSFRWPLTESLAVVGRWNYSLQSERSLETVGGIELESCCWALRVVGRRFLRNAEGAFDTGVFAQVQFRGLGGFGKKSGSLLRRGIPGYEDPFE